MSAGLRLLVTGAAGWIGSEVVREAGTRRGGLQLFTTDIVSTPPTEVPFLSGDLCDPEFAGQLLCWAEPDVILHLAGTNHNAPADLHWRLNVGGTVNLLDACQNHKWAGRFVNLGSAAEYGRHPERTLYDEEMPCEPRGAYGISKYLQFQSLSIFQSAGWTTTHVRLFNPIGPGMRPHLMLGRLIAQLADAARAGTDPLRAELWTPHPVRDYIALTDVASILVRLATEGCTDPLLNLGTGTGHSVSDIVSALGRVIGSDIEVDYTKRHMGQGDVIVADIARLRRWLPANFSFKDVDVALRAAWADALRVRPAR